MQEPDSAVQVDLRARLAPSPGKSHFRPRQFSTLLRALAPFSYFETCHADAVFCFETVVCQKASIYTSYLCEKFSGRRYKITVHSRNQEYGRTPSIVCERPLYAA